MCILGDGQGRQGRPALGKLGLASPRLFPTALVALAPIAQRAAFVLEPPPLAAGMGARRLVASVEQQNDKIECVVGVTGFDAGEF